MDTVPRDDEIDLRTLLLILRQQIKWVVTITLIVTLLGSVWALTRPQQYTYRQTIRLAHYFVAGKPKLVQPTATIVQLMKNVYLPVFEQQYHQQQHSKNLPLAEAYTITSTQDDGTLYLSAEGDKDFKNLFIAANHYLLAKVTQEQQPYRTKLLKHIQTKKTILSRQLAELEKLQKAGNAYLVKGIRDGERIGVANLQDYSNSLVAQQNQVNIIKLRVNLANLQQQESMTMTTLGKVIQLAKPELSPAIKIVLSFFVGLFLAMMVIFLKHSLRRDDEA